MRKKVKGMKQKSTKSTMLANNITHTHTHRERERNRGGGSMKAKRETKKPTIQRCTQYSDTNQ